MKFIEDYGLILGRWVLKEMDEEWFFFDFVVDEWRFIQRVLFTDIVLLMLRKESVETCFFRLYLKCRGLFHLERASALTSRIFFEVRRRLEVEVKERGLESGEDEKA